MKTLNEIIACRHAQKENSNIQVIPLVTVPTPCIQPIKVSGKNKKMYESILLIIKMYRNTRFKACPSVVSISSTGFLTTYINSRNLINYIREMMRVGILRLYDEDYKFGGTETYSRRYIWFPKNEELVLQELEKQGVKLMTNEKMVAKSKVVSKINTDLIRWSSSTKILRPEELSIEEMEVFIREVLRKKYPELVAHQKLVAKINGYYAERPERLIAYQPHIEFSQSQKAVSSIGIRYTCEFCSYPKEPKPYMDVNRKSYLKTHGLDLEYDVSGSVPRVSRLLSFGCWNDRFYDPYKEIWGEYLRISELKQKPEWNEEQRQICKYGFMDCFFDTTLDSIVNHTFFALKKNGFGKPFTEDAVKHEYGMYLQAVESVCGKSIGSEIFFHESNIYIEVLKTILEDGFDCVTCYDCFYASKKGVTQDEFEKYMDNLITKTALGYVSALKSTAGR